MGWKEVRDWEVLEAVSSLGDDSYDLVGRDIPFAEDHKFHFFRYKRRSRKVEGRFYHSGSEESRESAEKSKEEALEILRGESFEPELYTSSIESSRPGYEASLTGNYFVDYPSAKVLNFDLADVIDGQLTDLDKLECKY